MEQATSWQLDGAKNGTVEFEWLKDTEPTPAMYVTFQQAFRAGEWAIEIADDGEQPRRYKVTAIAESFDANTGFASASVSLETVPRPMTPEQYLKRDALITRCLQAAIAHAEHGHRQQSAHAIAKAVQLLGNPSLVDDEGEVAAIVATLKEDGQ